MRTRIERAVLAAICLATTGLWMPNSVSSQGLDTGISGHGFSTQFGQWTIMAQSFADGSFHGRVKVTAFVDSDTLAAVVPPSDGATFWCLQLDNVPIDPIHGYPHVIFFIEDSGDGKDTFDRVSIRSGPDTCASVPQPAPGEIVSLDSGNFRTLGRP